MHRSPATWVLQRLVVGAPDDRIDGIEDSGSATFVPGPSSGPVLTGSRMLTLADFVSDHAYAHFGAGRASGLALSSWGPSTRSPAT